jgi:ribonuclease-3
MYEPLFEKLNYRFTNIELLKEALTHPSAEKPGTSYKNYERLEFLGDAILAFIITCRLLEAFPNDSEGNLAKRRTSLVNGLRLSSIASEFGLKQYISIEKTHEISNRVLENVCEAVIGAMYLDGGIAPCEWFITTYWDLGASDALPPTDAKTTLQEWSQKKRLGIPSYTMVERIGSAHHHVFVIEVSVQDIEKKFRESAPSKKEAEQKAAAKMLEWIRNNAQD